MADAAAFTKLVPGFDFLQGLVKNAGSALPNIGQWVAPTLNPEELEKIYDSVIDTLSLREKKMRTKPGDKSIEKSKRIQSDEKPD